MAFALRRVFAAARLRAGLARRRAAPAVYCSATSDKAPPPSPPAPPPASPAPFLAFCAAAEAKPGVAKALALLEEEHLLDPEVVLLGCWLPGGLPELQVRPAEVGAIARVARRYRKGVAGRLRAAAHSARDGGTPDALDLAGAIEEVASKARTAERAALHATCEELLREQHGDAEGEAGGADAPQPHERGAYVVEGLEEDALTVHGRACGNLQLYAELAGAVLRLDSGRERLLTVLEAALEGFEPRPEADALDALLDPRVKRPRKMQQLERNLRYQLAKDALVVADEQWREAIQAYRAKRRLLRAARHDVYRTRKAVRKEFR